MAVKRILAYGLNRVNHLHRAAVILATAALLSGGCGSGRIPDPKSTGAEISIQCRDLPGDIVRNLEAGLRETSKIARAAWISASKDERFSIIAAVITEGSEDDREITDSKDSVPIAGIWGTWDLTPGGKI